MKDTDRLRRLWLAVFTAIAPTMVVAVVLGFFGSGEASLVFLIIGLSVAALIGIATPIVVLLVRSPYSFVIALVGLRGTGKTIFLTSLFDYLMTSVVPGFDFAPYGVETLDEVTRNLDQLTSGKWLPSTTSEDIYHFRAQAVSGKGLLTKRFKLEIGDYPGESSTELVKGDGKRLHKSDYFKDIVQSDAVFLAIGCDVLLEASEARLAREENALVAALNYLKEMKGVPVGRPMRTPLAIILTKADLLGDIEINQYSVEEIAEYLFEEKMPRLTDHANKICSSYSLFVVSAVGHLGSKGSPPPSLRGIGVEAPLQWVLARLSMGRGAVVRNTGRPKPERSLTIERAERPPE